MDGLWRAPSISPCLSGVVPEWCSQEVVEHLREEPLLCPGGDGGASFSLLFSSWLPLLHGPTIRCCFARDLWKAPVAALETGVDQAGVPERCLPLTFIASPVTTAKQWNQPWHPATEQW